MQKTEEVSHALEPLANFQEQAWKVLFSKDIYPLVEDSSYEDNQVRIHYTVANAEDFVRIRKVTDLNADSLEKPFLIHIEVENKSTEAEMRKITYKNIPLSNIPLLTSSGFYINGTPYGVLSESTLAPGWYISELFGKWELTHRSRYGANLNITYKKGQFAVKFSTRRSASWESVDLWTFLKAISGSETFSDILNRLNRMDIFLADYIRVQKQIESAGPTNAMYAEPSVERCAEKVVRAHNRYIGWNTDCVAYLQKMLYIDNRLQFETERKTRFKKMCGFAVAVGMQLARDVVFPNGGRIKKGTTIAAGDVARMNKHGVEEIYVEHHGKSYKLFEVSIDDTPTMNEIVAAIYYLGLAVNGIGKPSDQDDFINKTTRTVSTMVAGYIEKQLDRLTNKIISKFSASATTGLVKLFTAADLAHIRSKSLRDTIFSEPSYNMRDETNSISAFQQSYKLTSSSKDLGKRARAVKSSHFGRVCPFTTPESKPVGLNLSLTLGSQVCAGYITYPAYKVIDGVRQSETEMLTDTMESNKIIAPYDAELDTPGNNDEMIPNCRLNGEITLAKRRDIAYQDKNPLQNISPILLLVPSLNRDSGKRLTMAQNAISQGRQPVKRVRPYCSTGIEAIIKPNVQTARDILEICMADIGLNTELITPDTTISLTEINTSFQDAQANTVSYGTELVFNSSLSVLSRFTYIINRLQPATNNSIKHQRIRHVPDGIYKLDDIVVINNDTDDRKYELSKEVLDFGKDKVDTKCLKDCALAFGDNVKVMFKSWGGYGYEDSVIVNERFAKMYGLATASIIKIKDEAVMEVTPDGQKIRDEQFSPDLDVSEPGSTLQYTHLDSNGLARVGAVLKPGQVAIGKKFTNKNKVISKLTKIDVGQQGTVINQFVLRSSESKYKTVHTGNVIIGNLVFLGIGDKVSGLHGNKGVVGKIVADADMPVTKFGTPDIILNPLGVISRTNIGQLVEAVLGMVGAVTGKIQFLEPFSKMTINEMIQTAADVGVEEVDVYDGRTGRKHERKAFMGNMYFLRSSHTSTSKYNACGLTDVKRNSVSQQPIKCSGGGQRIGELLANAFRAHNATKTLAALFTTQSDDTRSCKQLVKNIESGHPLADVEGVSHNAALFLAFFRTLGLNISKQGKENRFVPLTDADIEKLSLNEITPQMLSNSTRMAAGNLFLRDIKFLKQYEAFMPMEELKRTVYSSIKLPRKIIMPLLCYGDKFLKMFVVKYNGDYKLMSTNFFKRILFNEVVLIDKNFDLFPELVKRRTAEINGLLTENSLFGAAALMRIFEQYNLLYTIAFIESTLTKMGAGGFTEYEKAKGIDLSDAQITLDSQWSDDEDALADVSVIPAALKAGAVEIDSFRSDADMDDSSEALEQEQALNEVSNPDFDMGTTEIETGQGDEPLTEAETAEALTMAQEEVSFYADFSEISEYINDNKLIVGTADEAVLLQIRGDTIKFYETQNIQDYFVNSLLIPPIAYRPDFEGHIASPIDKQMLAVIGKLRSYNSNPSDSMFTQIYRELFWMITRSPNMKPNEKTVFESIVSHENKNSKVRDTLFAKRVLGSGRSVITVDPTLKLDECRVPVSIATVHFMALLLADRENDFPILNSYRIKSGRVDNGKKFFTHLFNCLANDNIIEFSNFLNLHDLNYKELKEVFDRCRQELKNKLSQYLSVYPVILNREPSLHKFNAMAFWGYLTDDYAFALHPLACRPYNADFDGDQMADFIPFTPDAIDETVKKMIQHNNLINPNNGKLIVDLNQDMILGLYWMTMYQSNRQFIENPNIVKVYNLHTKTRYLSVTERIQAAIERGEIQRTDVITFEQNNRKGYGYAEDAMYFALSDRINEEYGCFELVGARRVPSGSAVTRHFTHSYEIPNSFNNYNGFVNEVFAPLWQDISDGVVKPQDFVIVCIDEKSYRSTAGRILFNSMLPDGIGFTSEKNSAGFYSLLFDILVNSKSINPILDLLRERYSQESANKIMEPTNMQSEYAIISENNIKFCNVLDRLKDIGFYMADLSCISISLYDFRALELARTNISINDAMVKKVNMLNIADKNSCLQHIKLVLVPMESLIRTITLNKYTSVPEKKSNTAITYEHLMIYLNDQMKSPYDYVYVCTKAGMDLKTIAQAVICTIVENMQLPTPITVDAIMNSLTEWEDKDKLIDTTCRLISMITDIASKLGISYVDYMPMAVEDLMMHSGANLMKRKLEVIAKKYKEGRLTNERKRDLILSVTEEYKSIIMNDLQATLESSRNSNLFIMVDSGARGNKSQLMEVCGVIGTVADGDGNPIPTPIDSNLLNGLNPQELFTSSYHARSILVNTQMDIPVSGTLNRKLSYLTDYIKIRPETESDSIFCGTDSVDMPLRWVPVLPAYVKRLCLSDQIQEDESWRAFTNRYFANNNRFSLTAKSIQYISHYAKITGKKRFQVFQKQELIELSNDELREGMDLFIGDHTDEFAKEFRNEFVKTCAVTESVQQLLSEGVVTKLYYLSNGDICDAVEVPYRLEKMSRDSVYYRAIDLDRLPDNAKVLAKQFCMEKQAQENRDITVATIIGNRFLEELEKHHIYLPFLPIFTIVNCKSSMGICRKCFGLKYDTDMLPEPGELIGFQGVQAVCSTLSQMILDTHKSAEGGGHAKDEIKNISQLIDKNISVDVQLDKDVSNLCSKVKGGLQDPGANLEMVNDCLHGSALNIIIKSREHVAQLLAGSRTAMFKDASAILGSFDKLSEAIAKIQLINRQEFKISHSLLKVVVCQVRCQENLTQVKEQLSANIRSKLITASDSADVQLLVFTEELSNVFYPLVQSLQGETHEEIIEKLDTLVETLIQKLSLKVRELAPAIAWDFGKLSEMFGLPVGTDTIAEVIISTFIDPFVQEELRLKQALTEPAQRSAYDLVDSVTAEELQAHRHNICDFLKERLAKTVREEPIIDPKLEIEKYIKCTCSSSELALYIKLSVWFDMMHLMRGKGVLARNLELFPRAMIECGIALEDYIDKDTIISTGCIYRIDELERAGVHYSAVKLSTHEAIGNNGQIYSDAFLGNTRQTIIKHVIRGTNDVGSPIGEAITGKDKDIIVEGYPFGTRATVNINKLVTVSSEDVTHLDDTADITGLDRKPNFLFGSLFEEEGLA